MLVYGSLVVGGMVFPGYDSGFQPSLAGFLMPWCWDIFFFGLDLLFFG